jgi:hypothetical protein
LTGRKQRLSQVMVLRALGLTHKVRPDGSLVVLRAHVEHELGGKLTAREREAERQSKQEEAWRREFEANLEAMRADEERARKRKAQAETKKERINRSRKERGLPPLK